MQFLLYCRFATDMTEEEKSSGAGTVLTIGDSNIFEVGSRILPLHVLVLFDSYFLHFAKL